MFGIKTKVVGWLKSRIYASSKTKLVQDWLIKDLMNFFLADERGHRANIQKADLGFGWMHYGLVRTLRPQRILCVGSRYGYIPAVLAQACKDNRQGFVDFVDAGYGADDHNHWTGEGYWRIRKGREAFKRFGLGKWIQINLMTTAEFAKRDKKTFEYMYIDGDHSYEVVKKDFELFWPRLYKGGFMLFHDISVQEPQPEGEYGVHKFWAELQKKYANIEVSYPISGLGVIQKQKE